MVALALYYKAGGYPWALVRDPSDLQTCFIGISFYWDRDEVLATSLAGAVHDRQRPVLRNLPRPVRAAAA